MSATHLVALLLAAAASIANALEVTPGSHCAVECLDSPGGNEFSAAASTTTTDDITCRDVDYSTTGVGIKFRKCLDCLQGSTKVDKTESDLKWYICTFNVLPCFIPICPPHPSVRVDSTLLQQHSPITRRQITCDMPSARVFTPPPKLL